MGAMAVATAASPPVADLPAVASGAFACVLVGASFPVSALLTGYPIAGGQAVRYALAAVVLAAIARFRLGRPSPRELAALAAVAVTGMLGFNALVLLAVEHADPSLVGAIVGCSPVLMALSAPSARLLACAGIVVGGAVMVRGAGGGADAIGILAACGALICEVLFSVLMAPVLPRLGAVRASAWACVLAAGMLAVLAPLEGLAVPSGEQVAALGYLAFLTVAAFVAWYVALARLGVERAGLLVGIMPVSALAVSVALGHETPGPWQVAGVLVVGAGVAAGLRVSAAARRRP
jgi:drug/metabolite transporter (DMT)-like permease